MFWPFDTTPSAEGVCKDKICACVVHALCSIPFNLICNMNMYFQFFLTFWPTPRGQGTLCKDRICACVVFYAPFPLIWYATCLLSGKKMFWPFDPTPGVEGLCKDRIWACMVVDMLSSIPFNLICNMTTFRKKCFDLLTEPQRPNVCKDKICACVVLYAPFLLIWYATWPYSEKVEFWPPLHAQVFKLKPCLICFISIMFHIYCTSVCSEILVQKLITDLVIAKFKYLTIDPT